MIELSKATTKARGDLAELQTIIRELTPAIEAVKNESGDIDKLAQKCGTLSAKLDIARNRFEASRDKVLASLVEDCAMQHEQAIATFDALEIEYRDSVNAWKHTARATLPIRTANAVSGAPGAMPNAVQEVRRKRDKARVLVESIGAIRTGIDNAYRDATIGTAYNPNGTPRILPRESLMKNAAAIVPELAA